MSKMQRTKGANAERKVVNYLRSRNYKARRYLAGDGKQPGDIDGIPHVCIEVKDQAIYNFPAWLRQVHEEADDNDLPIVVAKPKGVTDPADWWVVMTLQDFITRMEDNNEL